MGQGSSATEPASTSTAAPAKAASSIIPDGVKKSWASMFASPAPVPAPKKTPEPIVEKFVKPNPPLVNLLTLFSRPVAPARVEKPEEPTEPPAQMPVEPALEPSTADKPIEPAHTTETPIPTEEPEVLITPSKDELTEDNLEQVPDTSAPASTATAAGTAASSWDPRSAAGTPYDSLQGQPQAVRPPPTSGFHASALKATGSSHRTPSHQRRILEQEEAVRMPGNREVERTAVQFGAFGLNGSGEEDVDGDREEPETRAQPPQHSPVAPRAALPPAPQQPVPVPESFPTKQALGLPAVAPTAPAAAPGLPLPSPLASAQNTVQQPPQGNGQYSQYGRFPQAGAQEQASLPQKPYDTFSQQVPTTQSQFEGYPAQQSQAQAGAFSSAPNEFPAYYPTDPQQRNAYNSYYQQQYGLQQGAQGQQEGLASQQRPYSGYNGPQAENNSQFPQSGAQQGQSRYPAAVEGQNSGHTTPNPVTQSQQQGAGQGAPQPGLPQQPLGNYPYGHPYYSSPYYAAYVNQFQQYNAGNYPGGPYGAKAGIHQQYPGYGMSSGAPYEHAASPAAGAFGASSVHGRDTALGGLADYGRAGSVQSAQTPQALGGAGAFGSTHDAFARGSSYQGQNPQHYGAQQGAQAVVGEDLKPYGDSKTANGPSPSLSQGNRPGSATNAAPGSALPPPQTQQGYGGYPAHLQQQQQQQHGLPGSQTGSQYGLGGAAGHQASGQGQQASQYGGYQGFGSNYYGTNQQQRGGGWGGNYGH